MRPHPHVSPFLMGFYSDYKVDRHRMSGSKGPAINNRMGWGETKREGGAKQIRFRYQERDKL